MIVVIIKRTLTFPQKGTIKSNIKVIFVLTL